VLFGNKFYDYPQCLLRLARFKGTGKEEFIDNQRVQGNIYKLLDAAMAFFFKHLSISGKIEGLYREEELSIPYKALRESCINAFCHRAYGHPGSSVGIAIYDDRVEIENTGTFPADVTLENLLKEHHSKPQNPLIANVLYKSEILESWGRGIGLMMSECRRVGIPEPEFHTDGIFTVVFKRKTNSVINGTVNGTVNGTINENEQHVLNLIKKEEGLNAIEIAERISKSLRMTKRYLKSLNDKKIIEFRGAPKTGGYYLINQI